MNRLILAAAVAVAVVIGWLIWDRRYKSVGGADFKPTDEVFIDPASGRRVRVYYDAKSGKREYRDEPEGDGPGGA